MKVGVVFLSLLAKSDLWGRNWKKDPRQKNDGGKMDFHFIFLFLVTGFMLLSTHSQVGEPARSLLWPRRGFGNGRIWDSCAMWDNWSGKYEMIILRHRCASTRSSVWTKYEPKCPRSARTASLKGGDRSVRTLCRRRSRLSLLFWDPPPFQKYIQRPEI